MVDILAAELKMDPVDLRLKNFVGKDEFPYATATGLSYDSGDYAAPLQKALDEVDYSKLRREQADARANGRLMGIGISTYGEICAMGPSAAMPAGGWESATVKIEPSGKVTVMTGASPHGQGQETTFAQIAADELGVDIDDVLVIHGDTAVVQYGIGTFGSRGTAVGGAALFEALQELKAKLKKFGAMLLESENVTLEGGSCVDHSQRQIRHLRRNRRGRLPRQEASAQNRARPRRHPLLGAAQLHLPLRRAHRRHRSRPRHRPDRDPPLRRRRRLRQNHQPALVDGQVHGGVAQGLGQALWEHAVYDDNGQLVTGELTDYAIPRAHFMPWIESSHTETPSPVNPLGVKGVGEAGTIGCSPAVVNSVVDALAPLGVRHIDMPLTPEKIWRLVEGARA